MKKQNIVHRLIKEIDRLKETDKFQNEPAAIEALEAVKFWAIKESVDNH